MRVGLVFGGRSVEHVVSVRSARTVLEGLTAGALAREGVHRFPIGDSTSLGFLAFLAQHESYHVGQAGFVRRQLGRPAMTYARDVREKSALME
jgi:uncharacterized damage-inducible protein DinB